MLIKAKRELEVGGGYILLNPAASDKGSPARPHLLSPPQTTPLAGDQELKYLSL